MFKKFDEVKNQLKELAEVVNSFKSEAVQLRVIDLIFGVQASEGEEQDAAGSRQKRPPRASGKRRRAASPTTDKPKSDGDKAPSTTGRTSRSSGRPGAVATLSKLLQDGFFKKPKTIKDIVNHADTNMALKFKQSEFSGSLARYVRDGKLKRTKNADNQYEYTEG